MQDKAATGYSWSNDVQNQREKSISSSKILYSGKLKSSFILMTWDYIRSGFFNKTRLRVSIIGVICVNEELEIPHVRERFVIEMKIFEKYTMEESE